MWEYVSIIRNGVDLERTEAILALAGGHHPHPTRPSVELANMLLVGWQMTRAALKRQESRGAHYRDDFSEPLPEWRRRLAIRLEQPHPLAIQ